MNSINAVSSDQRRTLSRICCTLLTFSYQIPLILSLAVTSTVTSREYAKPHEGWFGGCRRGARGRQIVHLSILSLLRRF